MPLLHLSERDSSHVLLDSFWREVSSRQSPCMSRKTEHHGTHYLLAGDGSVLAIFGQQADALDSGKLGDCDDVGDVLKLGIVIGFNKSDAFDADGKDIA